MADSARDLYPLSLQEDVVQVGGDVGEGVAPLGAHLDVHLAAARKAQKHTLISMSLVFSKSRPRSPNFNVAANILHSS